MDRPGAASEEELRMFFSLQTTGKAMTGGDRRVRPVELFMCSVLKEYGYGEGFRWLGQFL